MILIDQAVRAKLLSLPKIIEVIGDRLYPDFLPQRVKHPAGVMNHAGIDRLESLNGSQSGVKIDTFRIEIGSTRDYDVARIRTAIDRSLSGQKAQGRWNDWANRGPIVTFCTIDDAATQVERDRGGSDEHLRAVVCLLTVTWIDEEQE